ncbi:unnamed protein product, partial [Acanthoscelides obtectus]
SPLLGVFVYATPEVGSSSVESTLVCFSHPESCEPFCRFLLEQSLELVAYIFVDVIANNDLSRVDQIEYLDVWFDEKLAFNHHIYLKIPVVARIPLILAVPPVTIYVSGRPSIDPRLETDATVPILGPHYVKIVKKIGAQALQRRLFKTLADEIYCQFGELLLHSEVRWLSRERVLEHFDDISEIVQFFKQRDEPIPELENSIWPRDFGFRVDITEQSNELNLQLQVACFTFKNIYNMGFEKQHQFPKDAHVCSKHLKKALGTLGGQNEDEAFDRDDSEEDEIDNVSVCSDYPDLEQNAEVIADQADQAQAEALDTQRSRQMNNDLSSNEICRILHNDEVGRKRQENAVSELEKIYKQLIPISEMKKRDLEKLCKNNVIPARFHDEFFKLKCKYSLPDELAETDADDLEEFLDSLEVIESQSKVDDSIESMHSATIEEIVINYVTLQKKFPNSISAEYRPIIPEYIHPPVHLGTRLQQTIMLIHVNANLAPEVSPAPLTYAKINGARADREDFLRRPNCESHEYPWRACQQFKDLLLHGFLKFLFEVFLVEVLERVLVQRFSELVILVFVTFVILFMVLQGLTMFVMVLNGFWLMLRVMVNLVLRNLLILGPVRRFEDLPAAGSDEEPKDREHHRDHFSKGWTLN